MSHSSAPPDHPLRRLLVGTDFSPGAAAALSRLRHLPLAPRAEITVLHALPTQLSPALRARETAEAERRLRWEATRLGRALRAAGRKEVRVRIAIAPGAASHEILRRSGSMDLVVVGRHGRRPFRELLVGSTAQRVLQHGHAAILLVARRARAAYRRPLVAVDLSDSSQATLDLAVRVVAPTRPILDVVHVYETAYEGMLAAVGRRGARAAYRRECRETAREAVTKLIDESAAASLVHMVMLRHTDPRMAILEAARARRADLIALGTHGRTGLPHLLLGSVAEAVMHHATCDVLVAPPQPILEAPVASSGMTEALAVFVAAGALLVLAGTALTRAADAIAELTGLGRLWIGSVALAAATSLPELATDVSAVRLDAVDLAAGDLFGSSMANMLILAAIGYLPPIRPVFRAATPGHAVTACLAIVLNAAAGIFVLTAEDRTGWPLGAESVLLAVGFLVGMRVVYAHRADTPTGEPSAPPRGSGSRSAVRAALRRFALAALAVLVSAPAFAWSAKRIAELTGLGTTFIGTWLVGLATSLPEVVTSVAALRLGAVDLAIGNLFGSNAFNMVVFLAMDVAHPGGSIFAGLDPSHAISAFLAVVLMALGLSAIVLRSEGRRSLLEPGSALMVVLYVSGLWLLYAHTTGALRAGP